MTTTTRKPAKPRPADVCRLVAIIRGEHYTTRAVRPETPDVTRAWRLRKGDGTTYTCAETIHGAICDCGDFAFRHEGHDQTGCKHVRALRALGLIEPDAEDGPASWPPWTDSHAFATSH